MVGGQRPLVSVNWKGHVPSPLQIPESKSQRTEKEHPERQPLLEPVCVLSTDEVFGAAVGATRGPPAPGWDLHQSFI